MALTDDNLDDFSSEGEGDSNPLITFKSSRHSINKGKESNVQYESDESEVGDNGEASESRGAERSQMNTEEAYEQEADGAVTGSHEINFKVKKALQDKRIINASKKLRHKTGVVYLSSIPPYMKPAKMRQILSRFGDVDRLFLKREVEQRHKQRIRGGGNKKVMYEEGWAEFIRKRDAKLCAETLNGNIIGGKKGSFYHDDILNVKYLPGFKWTDLTEQIARENDIRQSKLEKEIAMANKLNAEYTKNVEISKTITNMKKSNKRSHEDDSDVHRDFKQYRVASARANAPLKLKQNNSSSELGSVLTNLL